jgi:hypothetical protein
MSESSSVFIASEQVIMYTDSDKLGNQVLLTALSGVLEYVNPATVPLHLPSYIRRAAEEPFPAQNNKVLAITAPFHGVFR